MLSSFTMKALNSHIRTEIREGVAREVANGRTKPREIARALGIDPRTVRAHLAALNVPQVPEPRGRPRLPNPTSSPGAPPAFSVAPGGVVEDPRQEAGRRALWDILNDPGAPPSARVSAFQALADAEAWSVQAIELPEPSSVDEVVSRFVALFRSFPAGVREKVRLALVVGDDGLKGAGGESVVGD